MSTATLRYLIFILCICAFIFFFIITHLLASQNPEVYYEPPTRPVYRAALPLHQSSPQAGVGFTE